MTEKLYKEKPYVMIVGPMLSSIGTATAEVSYNFNLTQVIYVWSTQSSFLKH